MTGIEADTTEIRFAASQLHEAADLLGAASSSFPDTVDAGEGSQPIGDVLGRLSHWAALNAGVHADVAGLLQDIASKIIDDEEAVADALSRISAQLEDES
ncbi:hypothetical protein [Microbacterium sp. UFMG61]|uniref:hypothetical protein n=1 Tax=Microbacterium sp. UFMG61 TaxID=2745935 RepID=UPI00188F9121|nr:hypothetical protein [Microbacterium sp. UFMG61]